MTHYTILVTFEACLEAEDVGDVERQMSEQIAAFDPPGDWTYEGWDWTDRATCIHEQARRSKEQA